MKARQWSEEQIIGLLQQAEKGETTISALCRAHNVSENTFYKWRQKYGGLQVNEARRLRELEQENNRLKKLLADTMLDNALLKEVLEKVSQPAQRRALVQQLQEQQRLSQRRVCQALGFERSSVRYVANTAKHNRDQALTQRLQQLAQQHPRFGYRRMKAMLEREDQSTNHKRVQRLWQRADLSLPRRRPKKRRGSCSKASVGRATRPNQIWCYDFVYDVCSNGAKVKMLTIEDEFTRESLAVEVGGSLPAVRVIGVLERLFGERGAPEGLRSDNGPEFVAGAIQSWLVQHAVQTHYIEPGRPWQNGIAESFNGKLRDECLSREWFQNRAEAAAIVARYQRYYNEERPHSSLGYQTPLEYKLAYEAKQLADKNGNA